MMSDGVDGQGSPDDVRPRAEGAQCQSGASRWRTQGQVGREDWTNPAVMKTTRWAGDSKLQQMCIFAEIVNLQTDQ